MKKDTQKQDQVKVNHAFSSLGKGLALLQTNDKKNLLPVQYLVRKIEQRQTQFSQRKGEKIIKNGKVVSRGKFSFSSQKNISK